MAYESFTNSDISAPNAGFADAFSEIDTRSSKFITDLKDATNRSASCGAAVDTMLTGFTIDDDSLDSDDTDDSADSKLAQNNDVTPQEREQMVGSLTDAIRTGRITREVAERLATALGRMHESGGAQAVEDFIRDIARGLPDGLRLSTSELTPEENRRVQDYARENNLPAPYFTRAITLSNENNERIARMRLTLTRNE